MPLITRSGKGSNLTPAEADGNLTYLDGLIAAKQAALVSGTNIKTINGSPVLGSGDITISDGGTVSDATASVKGIVQLAGDLGGTSALPTVPGLAFKPKVYNVKEYGALGNNVADDTVAIQNTINAVHAAGGGTVYFPNGIYRIAGALQTNINSSNPNSQLYIPLSKYSVDTGCHIMFLGEAPPNYLFLHTGGTNTSNNRGVVLLSTIQGTGTTPAVFGTPTSDNGYGATNYTNITFNNITIRTTTTAGDGTTQTAGTMSGCNFRAMSNVAWGNDFIIDVTSNTTGIVQPGTTYGLIYPKQLSFFTGASGSLRVIGYKNGVVIGEHFNTQYVTCLNCENGVVIDQDGQHGAYIGVLSVENSKNHIVLGANQNLYIADYHAEHHPGAAWYSFTYDVKSTVTTDRSVFFGHVNLGTWGSLGANEFNFLTNDVNRVNFQYLNGRNVTIELVTIGLTEAWNALNHKRAKLTLTGNAAITTTNIKSGDILDLLVIQDSIGSRTLTVNNLIVPINSGPLLYTFVRIMYDGTGYYYTTVNGAVTTTGYILFDDFNRANSASVVGNLGTPSTQAWTQRTGTWGIMDGKLYCSSAVDGGAFQYNVITTDATKKDNFTFECKMSLGRTSFNDIGLIYRYVDANNYFFANVAGAGVEIFKLENGTRTSLTTLSALGIGANVQFTMRVTLVGNVHTLFINGTQRLQITNSLFAATATNNVGMLVMSGSGFSDNTDRFDDVIFY